MIGASPRRLGRDQRGGAVIELAILAPVLALMTVGVVDLSNGFGRKLKLEQAAQRAIEKVMQTTGTQTAENTIIDEASAQAEVPVENVTVSYRLECDGAVQSDPEGNCPTTQKQARWVSVTVTDRYTPLFPVRFSAINSDGTYHISASSGMRTQ